ncbi:hypothetical protein [Thalassovita mangrovi]|uniref:Uncharacterized protein n=1 Tax=Thalassovita mangrovi TaxID=2692236 RepID=A0A6L8LK03_9RHOB|nr:hypothetical protein [Thalassovita mangrovi]MYM56304.1 hypothetical protein [Thalassovita mangrovi]
MITEADLQAHWRRDWIKAPGFEDATTRVHWMQCGALYADLRIPADRPDLSGAAALADLDPPALRVLMQAEGFAGTITVADSICTWDRLINWHGVPDGVDSGLMFFDDKGGLIEDGVDAEYRELWQRMPDAPSEAFRVTCDGMEGVLVSSGTGFLFGLGVPGAPSTKPLIAALEEGRVPAGLTEHFGTVYALGHWDGDDGIADLCTNPFLETRPVLRRSGQGITFETVDFNGQENSFALTLS